MYSTTTPTGLFKGQTPTNSGWKIVKYKKNKKERRIEEPLFSSQSFMRGKLPLGEKAVFKDLTKKATAAAIPGLNFSQDNMDKKKVKKTSEKKLVKEVKKKEEAPKMNPSKFSKDVFSTLRLKPSNKGLDLVQNMEKESGLQFLQPDDLKISKDEKKNKGLKGGAPPQKMYQKEKRPIKVPLNLRSIDEQIKYTESQLSKLPKRYSGAQLRKSLEIKLDQLKKQKVPKENLASDFSNMYKLMDNNVRSPESSVCCEDTSSVAPNDLAESLPSPTKKRSSPKSIFCSPGSTCTIQLVPDNSSFFNTEQYEIKLNEGHNNAEKKLELSGNSS